MIRPACVTSAPDWQLVVWPTAGALDQVRSSTRPGGNHSSSGSSGSSSGGSGSGGSGGTTTSTSTRPGGNRGLTM